jgi:hypothetical protein
MDKQLDLGHRPLKMLTTTNRPDAVVLRLMKDAGSDSATTSASSPAAMSRR